MKELLRQIEQFGIVPVVKIDQPKDAVPLAKALCDGGLPCAEITFRTQAAGEAIAAMTSEFPDMLIGAGTVLSPEQADHAVKAGAKFIVSPGFNPKVVGHCIDKGYPVLPGVATPSEIEQAMSFGLDVVKFFPAEAAGGLNMIKAMSAPYTKIRFMPTGGINLDNLNSYLNFGKVIACGGSWMVRADLINAGDFNAIRMLTQQAVEKMLGFVFAHVGINLPDETCAARAADTFTGLFRFEQREIPVSYFCSDGLEVMKSMGQGANGHIGIRTNNLNRAYAYLKRKGVRFREDTAKYDDKNKMIFIFLKDETGGFAIHLTQNQGA